jgi:hypothetical protein
MRYNNIVNENLALITFHVGSGMQAEVLTRRIDMVFPPKPRDCI